MSSSNNIDDEEQKETRELHPDDIGQLEQDEEEQSRDGNVGEGYAPRCKKLKMHDHNLPVQFPSMLSSNHFDNLIRRREVHHIPHAHVPLGWDIQRDRGSSAARKDVWGTNNYEILQAQKHTSMLVQVLIDHINHLTKVVEKHIQACDKKPPPADKDEA
ncbi:hypothetical protein CFC21_004103 [Triticum aestivum]|uniref:Uncharacterized protein n=1 Tax=Triticum aestivum TaxID=4565 RepID=A0A3B5Y7I4_WHEAT|nr:hypothetical protein CFC21_004103 [Triticum aestivum]